jgi:F-type H+-transporting ATPase subunit delta
MAAHDALAVALGHLYAAALLDVAEERGEAERVGEELGALAAELERSPAFHSFVASPRVDAAARAAALERITRGRTTDTLADALQVLNRKRRIEHLPAVARAYAEELDRRRGRLPVRVTSALPLAAGQRERLRAAVAARTGREPVLEERVDPALLGGLVVQIGDEKIDGSVATKIQRLSEALLARGSREIHRGAHRQD